MTDDTTGLPARFWAKVDKSGPDGIHSVTGENLGPCWLWTANTMKNGYGHFKLDGKGRLVHRLAHESATGAIADGQQVDHLCRVRMCVNPAHLEAVSAQVNVLRSGSVPAKNAAKTHCKRGHELAGDNLYVTPKGERQCKVCLRAASLRCVRKGTPAVIRTHCVHGHALDGENLYVHPRGGHVCRTCSNASAARWRERNELHAKVP